MIIFIRDLIFTYTAMFTVFLIFYLTNKHYKANSTHLLICMVFTTAMLCVYKLTGISPLSGFHTNIDLSRVALTPFENIKIIINSAIKHHNIVYAIKNILGNIILFIPIGLFIPLLSKPLRKFGYTLLFGISISFLIECSQLFLIRGSDIDDIILNTLGTVIGFVLYKLVNKHFCKFSNICSLEQKGLRTSWNLLPAACLFIPYFAVIIGGFIDRAVYNL